MMIFMMMTNKYTYIFKSGVPGRRAPGFLKSISLRECMRVCVCVYAPEAINN